MLALLGCAIGTSRVLEVKPGWLEGPRLYTAVVAETGTKKSPALQLAAQPFYARQHTLVQTSRNGSHLDAQGGADAADLLPRLAPVPKVRQSLPIVTRLADHLPSPPQLFTTDATLEALIVLLAQNPRGVALIQDELSGWVRSMNQYRGGRGADRQRWLSFWNGAPVIVNRKSGQQPIVLENPLVCVAGCIAIDVLSELSDERGRDDGFIHRLLFANPDPMPVRWTDAGISEQTLQDYAAVYDALWDLQGNGGQAGTDPPIPIERSFTAPARAVFIAFVNQLYAALADPHLPAEWRGPFAKFDGYGARLALILHLCRVVCGETDSGEVDEVSVRGMVRLMDYFKAHAQRVYARLRHTRADQRAAQACWWIRAAGGSCTVRELQRYRVAGVQRASEAEKLVSDLIDLGHGQLVERHLPSGRTQQVFVLHTDAVS